VVEQQLQAAGIEYYRAATTALDTYFEVSNPYHRYLYARADLVELVRIMDEPDFPGINGWDVAVGHPEYSAPVVRTEISPRVYIRCLEEASAFPQEDPKVFSFLYDPVGKRYLDKQGVYYSLRERKLESPGDLRSTAVLIARYGFDPVSPAALDCPQEALPVEEQRLLLGDILTGPHPQKALDFLLETGFVARFWPELPAMDLTEHSKEHHPEGNVWRHTLETLQYRNSTDLRLSLALLLHDIGKPLSSRSEENEFESHAEIGAKAANRFLRQLGYSDSVVQDVRFLIRYHMFPGAISRMPVHRSAPIMSNPLFPLLLELYRCDLSSTFRGPEGYYKACRTYRSFLKNNANPFRDAEGKKLLRLYVE